MSIYFFSFLAGLLTVLAPCVLPLLPLILGSALQKHRFGPIALALGLCLSFSVIGVAIVSVGPSLGIDPHLIRIISALLLLALGVVFISSKLQDVLSKLLAPLANLAQSRMNKISDPGLWGQFATGCLLGAIWSPCSGPTLGTAIALAAQEGSRLKAGILMLVFGVGASLPLVLVAYGSRALFLKARGGLLSFGSWAKPAFGIVLLVLGAVLLVGADKSLESKLLDVLPEWLTELTSSI